MEITWEKLIAAGLAACFFVACWIDGGLWGAFLLTLYGLLLPLAMIWFDEIIGGLTGSVRGGYMTETPPVVVRFLGWVFLLGIIGTAIYVRFKGQG
jgi:hypothetical protein